MKTLTFDILINAPREKVWQTLWDDKTYREWTSAFTEGSYAKSDWQQGSRIEFLNGKGSGMFSLIDKKVDNSQMTFKHLGEIINGIDIKGDWGDAKESYFLTEKNGQTELKIELDTTEESQTYFAEIFPKALQLVKKISE